MKMIDGLDRDDGEGNYKVGGRVLDYCGIWLGYERL